MRNYFVPSIIAAGFAIASTCLFAQDYGLRWMTPAGQLALPPGNMNLGTAGSTPLTIEGERQAARIAERAREGKAAPYARYAVLSNDVYRTGQSLSIPADVVKIEPFTRVC